MFRVSQFSDSKRLYKRMAVTRMPGLLSPLMPANAF